ncbi:MAG: tRNA (adenosine(37)-N6)-dimethylallyltransferase MiaA [Bacteroidia bacterium]|nr:tRNA (adenosine(37)-N6)-dimethylallyltransferase MiaA [Bacteroidia bacterium]
MQSREFNEVMVLGPTASGKTKLAVALAQNLDGEIVSLDSRQVYKQMTIGTGKDYAEYTVNGKTIPVHLIDVAEPGTNFHLHQYLEHFAGVHRKLITAQKIPVLCGGTALYVQALLRGFEFTSVPVNEVLRHQLQVLSKEELLSEFKKLPITEFTEKADTSTAKRIIRAIEIGTFLLKHPLDKLKLPQLKPLVFGIDLPREIRRARIAGRLEVRLQNGMIEEVQQLLEEGITEKQFIHYGLEYKFVVEYLQKKYSLEYMQQHLTIAIQQFAKRQMTWFRKLEREGLKLYWIDGTATPDEQTEIAMNIISSHTQQNSL